MGRIDDIIIKSRDTLADPNGERWSDARLIRLIDEAQKDICKQAKLLRTSTDIDINALEPIVQLPEDLLLLDRVLYQGKLVPLTSHLEMDRESKDWEGDTGNEVVSIIYDKQSRGQIKIYPILEVNNVDVYDITQDYGMATDISGLTNSSDFGVVTDITQGGTVDIFNSVFGVITDIKESLETITIYYIKRPSDIVLVTDILDIDPSYDAAIKYYITGKALRDDMDAQNRQAGGEELGFYERELRLAMADDATDFTRSNIQYETKYKGAFD